MTFPQQESAGGIPVQTAVPVGAEPDASSTTGETSSERGLATLFAGFSGVDAPAEADMYRCVHCGLCLSACPTYGVTALEMESPRGRIAFMKAVNEGRVDISERIVSHWEACLNCRACEAVCPSGVPYGRMMERTRAQVRARGKQSSGLKRMTRWFLRGLLPRPGLMRLGANLLRLYQYSGMQAMARGTRLVRILPGSLGELEAKLPRMSRRFFSTSRRTSRPTGEGPHLKVALLSGCVMPLMQAETMRATVRVLTRNGCEVTVPQKQGCCGALNLHAGDLETGRAMARRNIDIFLSSGVDRIVTCSAGCGASMKEYHELLKDDPVYADKARQASEMTRDINELLIELPFRRPAIHLERRVTYQDPCHLAHAQRISSAPREILQSITGVQLEEMENPAGCCGGAGIYSAVQPDLSGRILSRKVEAIAGTEAEEVITANPGCMLQLEQGLGAAGHKIPVRHVVDILDEAYLQEEPAGNRGSRRSGRRASRREPALLQVDLDEARAEQMRGYQRFRPLGRLQGPRRRQDRDR